MTLVDHARTLAGELEADLARIDFSAIRGDDGDGNSAAAAMDAIEAALRSMLARIERLRAGSEQMTTG